MGSESFWWISWWCTQWRTDALAPKDGIAWKIQRIKSCTCGCWTSVDNGGDSRQHFVGVWCRQSRAVWDWDARTHFDTHVWADRKHIVLPIWLYFLSICIFTVSIHVCVYSNTHTHLPPSSCTIIFASKYAYTFSSWYIFLPFYRHLVFHIDMHVSPHTNVFMIQWSYVYHV